MPSSAKDAHGTLLARQNLGSGAFVTIAELMDMTPPPITRNSFDVTPHNENIDQYVVGGVLRRGDMTLQIGYVPSLGTHDHLTGLKKSIVNKQLDGWRITYPDNSTYIFSGFVTNVGPSAPVEGQLVADVTIRPTGDHAFANGS